MRKAVMVASLSRIMTKDGETVESGRMIDNV